MKVALGKFACSGLEAHLGTDVPAAVRKSLVFYRQKLRAGRPPVDPPRFPLRGSDEEKVVFDVDVDPRCQALLADEADRRGTTLSALAAHAVMIYLAELEFLDLTSPPPGSSPGQRTLL
jgi:hypothetical protein